MFVLCAGMYRSCSTWQYEVVSHLLEHHRRLYRLGYVVGEQFAAEQSRWARTPGWKVLKSHEEHPGFARALAGEQAVVVYAYRDVRDVVFSMLHKRSLAFETFLRQGMIHQILANHRFWSRQPRLLSQRYEDIVAQPVRAVTQLAAHLGLEIRLAEARAIAHEYSFQANRSRVVALACRLRGAGFDLSDPANAQWYDGETLLHWNHMREGRVGTWRELATPRQRVILARLLGHWLEQHGYGPDSVPDRSVGAAAAPLRERLRSRLTLEWELARGQLTCALRCAALNHPRSARLVKQIVGLPHPAPTAAPARPAPRVKPLRRDRAIPAGERPPALRFSPGNRTRPASQSLGAPSPPTD